MKVTIEYTKEDLREFALVAEKRDMNELAVFRLAVSAIVEQTVIRETPKILKMLSEVEEEDE